MKFKSCVSDEFVEVVKAHEPAEFVFSVGSTAVNLTASDAMWLARFVLNELGYSGTLQRVAPEEFEI